MEEKEDGTSLPCPLFFRTHCPDIKRGCKYHHNTQMCSQGGACITKTCVLRHPPNCQLFLQGWCGFITKQGIPKRYRHCSYFHPPNVPQIAPSSPQNSVKLITASNPLTTTPPASIVKSQNDDARKVTRKEAVLVVQGEPTSLQPPQLPGDSKTISQLQTDLGEALKQITRLENLTGQLQKSLKLQAEIISSNTTQIARLFNNMDYRIQGKILPRILDIEEYLQKFKQAEAEVVPSLSSVEVGFEVGVDNCPPPLGSGQPQNTIEIGGPKFSTRPKITKNHINLLKSTITFLNIFWP